MLKLASLLQCEDLKGFPLAAFLALHHVCAASSAGSSFVAYEEQISLTNRRRT